VWSLPAPCTLDTYACCTACMLYHKLRRMLQLTLSEFCCCRFCAAAVSLQQLPVPCQWPAPSCPGGTVHIAFYGDTLNSIAAAVCANADLDKFVAPANPHIADSSLLCPGDGVCCPSTDCRVNALITCSSCHACSNETGQCEAFAAEGVRCGKYFGLICVAGACVNNPVLIGQPCLEPVGSFGHCELTTGSSCNTSTTEKFVSDECYGDDKLKCCVPSSYPSGKPCGPVDGTNSNGSSIGTCRWLRLDTVTGRYVCPEPGQTAYGNKYCKHYVAENFQCCV
jgi:hypothetical protein